MKPHHPSSGPNELARLVKAWRHRLKLDDIPGLTTAHPQMRRRRYASQELVASLTGYSMNWYGMLERGERRNYSHDFLASVATVLRLSDTETTVLFALAKGQESIFEHASHIDDTEIFQRVVDVLPWPAYVCDGAWDIIAFNEHLRTWFPSIDEADTNVMRWAFTNPEAKIVLHEWATKWAPPMFAEMQYALALQPDNPRLTAIVEEILVCSPEARRFQEQAVAYRQPDGDRRALRLPQHDHLQAVEVLVLAPLRDKASRLSILVPVAPQRGDRGNTPRRPSRRPGKARL